MKRFLIFEPDHFHYTFVTTFVWREIKTLTFTFYNILSYVMIYFVIGIDHDAVVVYVVIIYWSRAKRTMANTVFDPFIF